jgi:hypothetical protein
MKISSLNFYGLFCTSLLFASPKPNIVHIMVDDLGWQDIASHKVGGNTVYETPHLDKLTRTGRRFTEPMLPPLYVHLQGYLFCVVNTQSTRVFTA